MEPGKKATEEPRENDAAAFARLSHGSTSGMLAKTWQFLRARKAYWLAPIIFWILLLGALVFFGSTAAAPFIYTLF
jgi:hypothetical protein